jgi:predicted glycogen debranching enzyme
MARRQGTAVLTLRKSRTSALCLQTAGKNPDELLGKEWLLTNSRGGYSSSTVVGCNTRRYHGLLIGSLTPPTGRIMALASCLEMVIRDSSVFNLSTFEFNHAFSPEGYKYVKAFRRDAGAHFDYQFDDLQLTKSVYLMRDIDTVAIGYRFSQMAEPVEFAIRPFVGLRDFHSLQRCSAPLVCTAADDGLMVRHNVPESCELFIKCPAMTFRKDSQWWFNFIYRCDRERGQDFTEDLWTPGFFKCRIDAPTTVVLWANLSDKYDADKAAFPDFDALVKEQQHHQQQVAAAAGRDTKLGTLFLAADQFIVKRMPHDALPTTHDAQRTTILAGYPWFADWGRDALLSLPGLLLATGRFDEAKSVLTTFADSANDGLIPNCFDDYGDAAHFNSVDASLWFIDAAFRYLQATGDIDTFGRRMLPVILSIIEAYRNGTRFGIHADDDGLITAGDRDTQLTWMDAKYEGVAFTPRYGKPVEVNALWYNVLMRLARFFADDDWPTDAERRRFDFGSMAQQAADSFARLFWNDGIGCLNDCILPDGRPDTTLRPNQIFAVSLPFSALSASQQRAVVAAVEQRLLTPYGLRTLDPDDSRYVGTYTGPQETRDRAYHQGTAWPYLMGAFVEAYLKVNNFSTEARNKSAGFIEPLMRHITEAGCLGQLCEIFDGNPPHKPRGCFAQAWSIAELIRAYLLIKG